jgi:ABC-2 type transport system ATP-binding protein
MKRQVFVSLALAIKPKYLFLDEAFDGLDPLARIIFKKAIFKLIKESNTTVIISSHSLRELEDLCSAYGILDNKNIISSGLIGNNIKNLHKYQVAFIDEYDETDFEFDIIKFKREGRVINFIVNEPIEIFSKNIEKFKPLIIDEIDINFEELFIAEVENRGYLR